VTALPFAAEVAAYLDGCETSAVRLNRRYHPTEDGAVKCIPHRHHHDREADQRAEEQIRAAYRAAVASRRESGTSGTSGTRAGQEQRNVFRAPVGVPEHPEHYPPVTNRRQEEPTMDAPLERRIAAPVPPAPVGGTGPGQSFGGGGVGEPRTAQFVDHHAAFPIKERVRPPVDLDTVEPAGPDHAVVVHQRDAGFVRHGHDASAPAGQEELRNAALACAARGWLVFPVTPRAKKPPAFPAHTAERCDGTDPRCRNGHVKWEQRATADPARITRAWSQAPYNVGVATGPSGLIVIDLDVPRPGEEPPARWKAPGVHEGADVLAVLCEEHGEAFPWETFTARTRRGGLHLYFEAPASARLGNTSGEDGGGLGWKIDTRAHGGYVLAPGSFVDLPDGTGRYEVTYDRPPAPLPGWLAALLTAPRPAASSLECRSSDDGTVRAIGAYARAALQRESEAVRGAVTGSRTHALNKAAYHLGQLIAVGALDDATAETALYEAASVHFAADQPVTPAEARASIRGGITAGKRRPRRIAA
jgi:hypothetical protein